MATHDFLAVKLHNTIKCYNDKVTNTIKFISKIKKISNVKHFQNIVIRDSIQKILSHEFEIDSDDFIHTLDYIIKTCTPVDINHNYLSRNDNDLLEIIIEICHKVKKLDEKMNNINIIIRGLLALINNG